MKVEFEGRMIEAAGFETEEAALEVLNNSPEPSLEQIKRGALSRINALHAQILKTATGKSHLRNATPGNPRRLPHKRWWMELRMTHKPPCWKQRRRRDM